MPTYLVHGFRWARPDIRIHIILENLEDAAAEWIVAPMTTIAITQSFYRKFPDIMPALSHLRFVEQYDPTDESGSVQAYAYVADFVHEVRLDADIDAIRGQGVPEPQWSAMLSLRDSLAPQEKVAWYIVVCGDEERYVPTSDDEPASMNGASPFPGTRPAVNGNRPASRTERIRGEDRASDNAQAKRSTSITRAYRRIFGGNAPSASMETHKDEPKQSSKGVKEQQLPVREVKKSRSMRSLRSLTSRRSREGLRDENHNHNSSEPMPPLPGTAK